MADYRFETTWRIQAHQSEAWALLLDGAGWPAWWPSVRRVELLSEGAPGGVDRRMRYHFGTRLPYTLTFVARLVEVVAPLAAPLFAWNHAALMREGGDGFAARLGTVAVVESGRDPRRPRPRGRRRGRLDRP